MNVIPTPEEARDLAFHKLMDLLAVEIKIYGMVYQYVGKFSDEAIALAMQEFMSQGWICHYYTKSDNTQFVGVLVIRPESEPSPPSLVRDPDQVRQRHIDS